MSIRVYAHNEYTYVRAHEYTCVCPHMSMRVYGRPCVHTYAYARLHGDACTCKLQKDTVG